MAIVVRLYNINSPNNFTVSIKEGNSAYPLLSTTDYFDYGAYDGGTTEIDITDYNFNMNQQYWIRIIDNVVNSIDNKRGYIVENIYIDSKSINNVSGNTIFVYIPASGASPSPTPTPTPSITPSSFGIYYTYYRTLNGYVTSVLACEWPVSVIGPYSDTNIPSVGVYMYSSPLLTSPFIGGYYWYKIKLDMSGTEYLVLIDDNGQILEMEICIPPSPSPTPTLTPTPSMTSITSIKTIVLSWVYTDGIIDSTLGTGDDSPSEYGYWNLVLSTPLSVGESIDLTFDIILQDNAYNVGSQSCGYVISTQMSGNPFLNPIPGYEYTLLTIFPSSIIINKTYTLTSIDSNIRTGLSASIDGDVSSYGDVVGEIITYASGNGVNVIAPITPYPRIKITPNA